MELIPLDDEIRLVHLENNINRLENNEQLLGKDFKIDVNQFYSEKYREYVIEEITIHDENSEEVILGKDETLVMLVEQLDFYMLIYKLPPLTMSNKEWDEFFDVVYDFFCKKRIESLFCAYMENLLRVVLATALVNKTSEITKQDFIDCLEWLVFEHLTDDDIQYIKNQFVNKCKIIDFRSHYRFDKKIK